MSNTLNLEPRAFGLITLKTTFGNVDIELFTKQCPKATRNFVQLCLDGYYNNTIFERVEKDFIAVGGVPDSSQSISSEETFPDEFHSRLRFTRRGLVATANTKRNENGPKFFFTLGPAPELQNKHTIFGRVFGNSVYSLMDLNECQVDEDCNPYSEQKINEVVVIENPFPDLLPRSRPTKVTKTDAEEGEHESDSDDPLSRPKPDPNRSKKLSFYPDDDEEEDEDGGGPFSKRQVNTDKKTSSSDPKDIVQNDDLKSGYHSHRKNPARNLEEESEGEEGDFVAKKEESLEEIDAKEKRMREIRAQIQSIKEQIESGIDTRTRLKRNKEEESPSNIGQLPKAEGSQDSKVRVLSKKSKNRERETIELVSNFKKKLKEASSMKSSNNYSIKGNESDEFMDPDELDALDRVDGDDWLKHKFVVDDD